jgi:dolichyl-phosphate-mannose--protein O-mannosyl transferase
VAIGCAASIKLSGLALALPLVGFCMVRPRRLALLSTLALVPVTYVLLFGLGLVLTHDPHGIADVWNTTFAQLAHHAALTGFKNPMSSRWYTWFLPLRPILLRYDMVAPDTLRAMTTLGNLASWWLADLMFVVAAVASLVALARLVWRRQAPPRFVRSMGELFAYALAMFLPWVVSKRDSYIYHYLPTYALLLVLVGGATAWVYRRRRWAALILLTVTGLVTVFYAPVVAQLRLTPAAYQQRLFLGTWR